MLRATTPTLSISLSWFNSLSVNLQTWRTESDVIKGLFELFLRLKVRGQNIYSDTPVPDKRVLYKVSILALQLP